MDGGQPTGPFATSVMEQAIPEEPEEGEGDQEVPRPLTTPPEADSSPYPGQPQMVSVELAPETSLRAEAEQEKEEEREKQAAKGEEREEHVTKEDKSEEQVVREEVAANREEVDATPAETVVTITRHPQKNTFGIKFEVSG